MLVLTEVGASFCGRPPDGESEELRPILFGVGVILDCQDLFFGGMQHICGILDIAEELAKENSLHNYSAPDYPTSSER